MRADGVYKIKFFWYIHENNTSAIKSNYYLCFSRILSLCLSLCCCVHTSLPVYTCVHLYIYTQPNTWHIMTICVRVLGCVSLLPLHNLPPCFPPPPFTVYLGYTSLLITSEILSNVSNMAFNLSWSNSNVLCSISYNLFFLHGAFGANW